MVLAIVVVVVALAIPAIQKARAAADQLICATRLRQLATAAHLFHNDHGRLPPGWLGPSVQNSGNQDVSFAEGQWVGHMVLLLPSLEQTALARRFDANFDPEFVADQKWWWSQPAAGPGPPHVDNYRVAMTPLPFLRCPSAPDYAVPVGDFSMRGGGTLLGIHVFNDTSMRAPFTSFWRDEYGPASAYRPLARTNYVGVAGCGIGNHPFFSRFEGVYVNRSTRTLGQIAARDGASLTLLYGETCGSQWVSDPLSRDISWVAAGALGTYLGIAPGSASAPLVGFSSYHLRGANFSFADGSVRMLRFTPRMPRTVDPLDPPEPWYTLQQLAGWAAGGPRDAAALED
ncbi:MAG TPA: DUF1559 domain-containing protein [Gemmatales bacterium]|nr:DUF1559 domain-containing protein [Gemmatales bacterium]